LGIRVSRVINSLLRRSRRIIEGYKMVESGYDREEDLPLRWNGRVIKSRE